jgi:hypothetical protein
MMVEEKSTECDDQTLLNTYIRMTELQDEQEKLISGLHDATGDYRDLPLRSPS